MPKPIYGLPLAGKFATKQSHDAEINRVVGEIWDAAVVASLGPQDAEALVTEFQGIRDATIDAADEAAASAASLSGSVEKLNRTGYMELAAPYSVKPLGWRWPLQAFQGALAEDGKTSTAQSWTHVLDRALKSGEKISISQGQWPMREKLNATTGISVLDDTPVDVEATSGAEIILGPEYPFHTGGFIDIRASAQASIDRKVPLRWIGGKFNVEALTPSAKYGITIFDIFQRTGFRLQDIQFWAGYNKNGGLLGNVDTAITTHNCNGGIIENCDFTGMLDAGVYLSGDYSSPAWDGIGEGEIVRGCRFRRVQNMVVFKRDHMGATLIDNRGYEVFNGYLASPASQRPGSQGESVQIRGGFIKKCRGRPVYLETGLSAHVSDMVIEDFGFEISDPTIPTSVASGNNIAGIDLRGVNSAIVHDNLISLREWAGGTAAGANYAVIGIRAGSDDTGNSTKGAIVHDNRIVRLHRPILENVECEGNTFRDNVEIIPGAGTVLPSLVQGAGSVLLKPVQDFRATVDPGAIAAGGSAMVNVPASGIAIGDWVESWSFGNQNSGTAGILGLTVEVYTKFNEVEFILRNVTNASISIGNTIFRARVRKA